jgi:hypothetical protein
MLDPTCWNYLRLTMSFKSQLRSHLCYIKATARLSLSLLPTTNDGNLHLQSTTLPWDNKSRMSRQVADFSTLPTERRLQIWRYSCLTPRIIEMRTDDYPGNWNISFYPTRHGTEIRTIQWVTQTTAPAVLSVCHESREMALKVYTLRFEVLASGSSIIYINPLLDTIYGNFK